MIPATVRVQISHYLGGEPKTYLILTPDGGDNSQCVYWDLPTQRDEERSLQVRYQEIVLRISQLTQKNENDPQIGWLIREANQMLDGLPVRKKHGTQVVSVNELLKLDLKKGVRKEWWELRSRLAGSGICVFQGYQSAEALATRVADILIAMPHPDPYEFLRINQTSGNNEPVDTGQIIAALGELDAEYGIAIISATLDFVEFIFERPVEARRIAGIRHKLRRLCPGAAELTESIRAGRVALWWD